MTPRLKPEHVAFAMVAFVFLFAVIAALREGAQVRRNTANLLLCPLCGQEVQP
jgi:hypothetical protein